MRGRDHLTDRERILALEITDDHHEELHRWTAHRLEMGDHRMDHIEDRISRIRQDQREADNREREREEARKLLKEQKAEFRAARNQAIQTVVWAFAIMTGMITLWNFAGSRPPPHASAITAPAHR